MEQQYTAVIKRAGKWWIGWVEEVPGVNCQEKTRAGLLQSLRVTLEEALKFRCPVAPSENEDWIEVVVSTL